MSSELTDGQPSVPHGNSHLSFKRCLCVAAKVSEFCD